MQEPGCRNLARSCKIVQVIFVWVSWPILWWGVWNKGSGKGGTGPRHTKYSVFRLLNYESVINLQCMCEDDCSHLVYVCVSVWLLHTSFMVFEMYAFCGFHWKCYVLQCGTTAAFHALWSMDRINGSGVCSRYKVCVIAPIKLLIVSRTVWLFGFSVLALLPRAFTWCTRHCTAPSHRRTRLTEHRCCIMNTDKVG